MRTFASAFLLGSSLLSVTAIGCLGESEPSTDEQDIVGGVDAKSAKLDAIGTVGTKDYEGNYDFFCTATLIGPKVVLTAKHCATYGPNEAPRLANEKIYFAVGADAKAPKQVIEAVDVILAPINEGGFIEYGGDVAL